MQSRRDQLLSKVSSTYALEKAHSDWQSLCKNEEQGTSHSKGEHYGVSKSRFFGATAPAGDIPASRTTDIFPSDRF